MFEFERHIWVLGQSFLFLLYRIKKSHILKQAIVKTFKTNIITIINIHNTVLSNLVSISSQKSKAAFVLQFGNKEKSAVGSESGCLNYLCYSVWWKELG